MQCSESIPSVYGFTTSISHGVEKYFPRLWGTGISDAILIIVRLSRVPVPLKFILLFHWSSSFCSIEVFPSVLLNFILLFHWSLICCSIDVYPAVPLKFILLFPWSLSFCSIEIYPAVLFHRRKSLLMTSAKEVMFLAVFVCLCLWLFQN